MSDEGVELLERAVFYANKAARCANVAVAFSVASALLTVLLAVLSVTGS